MMQIFSKLCTHIMLTYCLNLTLLKYYFSLRHNNMSGFSSFFIIFSLNYNFIILLFIPKSCQHLISWPEYNSSTDFSANWITRLTTKMKFCFYNKAYIYQVEVWFKPTTAGVLFYYSTIIYIRSVLFGNVSTFFYHQKNDTVS